MRNVTLRDLLEAVKLIKKFIDFGDRANKLLATLVRAGVDISRMNPYDITSFIKLANMYRNQVEFDEDELMKLQEDFEDLLDTPLSEISKSITTINVFVSTYKRAKTSLSSLTKTMDVSSEELETIAEMFGLPLSRKSKVEKEIEVEEEEITEDEIKELREVIDKFRRR